MIFNSPLLTGLQFSPPASTDTRDNLLEDPLSFLETFIEVFII